VADAGQYVRSVEPYAKSPDPASCRDSRAKAPRSRRVAAQLKDAARKANPTADTRGVVIISDELHAAAWVPASLATDRFECLPDTIDPRGLKSK